MKDKESLERFVYEALKQGNTRDDIRKALQSASWSESDIEDALGDWSESSFSLPVPANRASGSSYEAFLYLLLYLSLGLTLFFAGGLVFELIDLKFPGQNTGNADALRWPAAIVLVNLPLFVLLHRVVERRFSRNAALRASPTRKWFTYLSLAIASGFLIGDVATLLYNLLGGDLSLHFVAKVLTVGLLAGGSFFYYLREMRSAEKQLR